MASSSSATPATFKQYLAKQREIANMKDSQISEVRALHPAYANLTLEQFRKLKEDMKAKTEEELKKTFEALQVRAAAIKKRDEAQRAMLKKRKEEMATMTIDQLRKSNPAYAKITKEQFDNMKKDMARSSVDDLMKRMNMQMAMARQKQVAMAAKFREQMKNMSPEEIEKMKEEMKNVTPDTLRELGGAFGAADDKALQSVVDNMGKIDIDAWTVPDSGVESKVEENGDEPPALE